MMWIIESGPSGQSLQFELRNHGQESRPLLLQQAVQGLGVRPDGLRTQRLQTLLHLRGAHGPGRGSPQTRQDIGRGGGEKGVQVLDVDAAEVLFAQRGDRGQERGALLGGDGQRTQLARLDVRQRGGKLAATQVSPPGSGRRRQPGADGGSRRAAGGRREGWRAAGRGGGKERAPAGGGGGDTRSSCLSGAAPLN